MTLVIVDKGFLAYGVLFRLSHGDDGQVTGRKHWTFLGGGSGAREPR